MLLFNIFRLEKEAIAQAQAALRPRPLTNGLNRSTGSLDSKSSEVNKAIEESKERIEAFKLQRNVNVRKTLDGSFVSSTTPVSSTANDNVVRRFVASAPLSGNSQIFKLITKTDQGKN